MTNNINVILILITALGLNQAMLGQNIFLRYNQLGYHPEEIPSMLILSDAPLSGSLVLRNDTGKEIDLAIETVSEGKWGGLPHQYLIQLPDNPDPGTYSVISGGKDLASIKIGKDIYSPYREDLLSFMRQQRCGYNPYFEDICHQGDGRIFYAPVPDSTYYDFTGGWHDAGDQLKYLITGSNATARMLMAYEANKSKFADQVDELGHSVPNGLPDILDEAKWGLDWILKLHPRKDWLIHQIADDRDHRGFKIPARDNAEYGWGPNSYRAAYFANGKPQGLGNWKSEATGIANLAGRCAAALAKASMIWKKKNLDLAFAEHCAEAAREIYAMGKMQEGFQQGNSFGAPYRYNEDSWADDMEWGAAELYKLTGQEEYLKDAIHYANQIRDEVWMALDTMNHYQKYPFMNMGHYALYEVAPDSIQKKLAGWYKQNIERIAARAASNAYDIGITFLWCSNNLLVNFITQVILYEEMTGDLQFHNLMLKHRDWLFGRNPWGTSMFTGIPVEGEYPEDVHLAPTALLNDTPAGGLIDGPIYVSTFNNLLGLTLTEADEFEIFQNEYVIYHDDIGDYSTNEPTMDGTADAILMWALLE
ncbi:MAG: glycoside hydrolase family 9 protein [Saprospiraceae bacterium]|nr:glycoside hydrolase family 9 protein [Saprospiraceae bacterium]